MRKYRKPSTPARLPDVRAAFDQDALKRICEMSETDFAAAYGMTTTSVFQKAPDNYYHFKDNGSNILAVAHLDTVGLADERTARFVDTEAGTVVFSRALDDRLGAYVILELLPALGITYDILLTVGEESGNSTAGFFEPPKDKDYNWMIEFDRGGTDVVMYQYEDNDLVDLVEAAGARVNTGSFSDISYLERLEIKGLNWGVGYQDYHGPRAHAFLEDTMKMIAKYLDFHEANADVYLPHDREEEPSWWARSSRSPLWFEDEEDAEIEAKIAAEAAASGLTYAEVMDKDEDRDADLLAEIGNARWPSLNEKSSY